MNLPFFNKTQIEKEFFLALIFTSGRVCCLLFEKTGEALLVLSRSEKKLPVSLYQIGNDELVEVTDEIISKVEEKLPPKQELTKTLFAVPNNWVVDGKISKEYLPKLKEVCNLLSLTPVGFIVSVEAILSFLHKKEGAKVSGIFVEAGEKHVSLTIVKNGEIFGNYEEEIIENVPSTIDSILRKQDIVEVLPQKIILLGFDNAKELQQKILAHSWSKSLSFLHLPQVEIISEKTEEESIILGIASQMGLKAMPEFKKTEPEAIAQETQLEDEEVLEQNALITQKAEKENLDVNSNEFGFYKDIDILENKNLKDFEKDVKISKEENFKEEELPPQEEVKEVIINDSSSSKFKLPSMPMNFPSFSIFSKGKKPLIYPLIGVILLIVFLFGYYFYFEKAQVEILLNKKQISKDLEVTFSTSEETSADKSLIEISEKEITVDGKENGSVTGIKETGEKAKGEVTIYNKTDATKKFQKGDVLVGPNNLLFNLNDDVNVASTSSFSTSFSNAKAKVEAVKFGKEYNLPSSTNFSFENISTSNFFAKNDTAFSGGTKKELKVVSEEDMSVLSSKLVDSLTKKAVSKLRLEVNNGFVLPTPLNYEFETKEFSKKEGDEASSINLAGSIKFTFGILNKSEVEKLSKQITSKEVDSSYSYSDKNSDVKVGEITEGKDGFKGKITINAIYLPNINTSEFASKLAGKNQTKVEDIVSTEGVMSSSVRFTRSIPFMPKILPFNKNNITISVKGN